MTLAQRWLLHSCATGTWQALCSVRLGMEAVQAQLLMTAIRIICGQAQLLAAAGSGPQVYRVVPSG